MNRSWYRQGTDLLREIEQTTVQEDEVAFWYLGQMGYIYKGRVTVYVDVMLNDHKRSDGTSARWYQPPFAPDEGRADYILCTHDHIDHLAPETVNAMAKSNPKAQFIVPAGCTSILIDLGVNEASILSVNAGESLELPGLTLRAAATAHPIYRKDSEGNDLSLAFHLEMNHVNILHPGDTYLTEQLIEDLADLPTPNLFFPPINGQDYFRTARDCIGNLNSLEAARLAQILHADLTVPSHFDMFIDNTCDPLEFARTYMNLCPEGKWHIPALGERFIYRK